MEGDIPDWVTADGDFDPEHNNVLALPPAKNVELPDAPQQAERAEKIIVGSLLAGSWSGDLSQMQNLGPKFYDPVRRCIVETCAMLKEGGHPVDAINVWAMLEHKPGLGLAITLENLGLWANDGMLGAVVAQKMDGLLAQVNESWQRREMLRCLSEARGSIVGGEELSGVLDQLGSASAAVRGGGGAKHIGPQRALAEALAVMHLSARGQFVPFRFGLPHLDAKFKIRPGQFVIIAGRPGLGKSAAGLQLAFNTASPDAPGLPSVFYISVEMSHSELIKRAVASRSDIRLGDMDDPPRDVLMRIEKDFVATGKTLFDYRIRFHEGGFKPHDIEQSIRAWFHDPKARKQDGRGALVVIDYLQLLDIDRGRGSMDEAIGKVSGSLKRLARELKIAVVALCQLNRQIESRTGGIPRKSDLRSSGNLEQDCDGAIGLSSPFKSTDESIQKRILDAISRRQGYEGETYEQVCDRRDEILFNIMKQRSGGGEGEVFSSRFVGSQQRFEII